MAYPPPESSDCVDDAVWYFDGSMLLGSWAELRCIGFGVVVVASNGDLLAYGHGVPPAWCSTAAAAEAWALKEVLLWSPAPPRMRTDCHALLDTLANGAEAATAPGKPLARIWYGVRSALDGEFETLVQSGKLVWMPAHCIPAAVKQVALSDGSRLTMVDWRANRLADGLAKLAARQRITVPKAEALLADVSRT